MFIKVLQFFSHSKKGIISWLTCLLAWIISLELYLRKNPRVGTLNAPVGDSFLASPVPSADLLGKPLQYLAMGAVKQFSFIS